MKNVLTIAALLLFVLAAGCGGNKTAPVAQAPAEEPEMTAVVEEPAPAELAPAPAEEPAEMTEAAARPGGILTEQISSEKLPENLFLNIKVKDHGTMKLKFHTKDAPLNVTNVANLAIKGFYNGLTFHRIVPGFVVQGGDPKGDGTGGPGYDVQAEIKHKHMKGSIAMARTGDQVNPQRRSSGSQFYLCIEPLPMLDNQYTVIGDMVEGLDVLAKLGQVKTGAMDRPVTPVVMESVTVTTE